MRNHQDSDTTDDRAGRQEGRADRQTSWMVDYQDRVADLIETSDEDTGEGDLERRRLGAMAPPTPPAQRDNRAGGPS